jgi:hypothetical protein
VKSLAMAQSADIHQRLETEGVRILVGSGRLADEERDLSVHQVDVLDADGVVTSTTVTSGFQGNDNVVLEPYYNSEGELLNVNGYYGFVTALGVSVQDADGTLWNLFSPYNPGADGATYSPSYQFINSVDTFVDDDGFLNYTAIDGDFTLVTTSGGTVNPVPIPAAAWLFLSGVGGLFMAGRRRSALARAR